MIILIILMIFWASIDQFLGFNVPKKYFYTVIYTKYELLKFKRRKSGLKKLKNLYFSV